MFATADISEFFPSNKNWRTMSDAESVQLIVLVIGLFRPWENAFLKNKDGGLDEKVLAGLSSEYTQPVGPPLSRHIWALRKKTMAKIFRGMWIILR